MAFANENRSGWLVSIFDGVVLITTPERDNPLRVDAVLRKTLALLAQQHPGAATSHDVLCLHVTDRTLRMVRVRAAPNPAPAPPTLAEIRASLLGVSRVVMTVNVSAADEITSHDSVNSFGELQLAMTRQIALALQDATSSGELAG